MFLGGHCFNILIHKYFSKEWEQISLVIKAKQQRAIRLSCIFLKFYINQFSNKFSFLHFPGLWNLNSFMWIVVSMLFFTLHESGFKLLSFKFMSDCLYFPNNRKDHIYIESYNKLHNIFTIKRNSFQRNMNL